MGVTWMAGTPVQTPFCLIPSCKVQFSQSREAVTSAETELSHIQSASLPLATRQGSLPLTCPLSLHPGWVLATDSLFPGFLAKLPLCPWGGVGQPLEPHVDQGEIKGPSKLTAPQPGPSPFAVADPSPQFIREVGL